MKRSPEGYAVILTRNTEYTGYRARTTWEATQVAKGAFGGVLAAFDFAGNVVQCVIR
jgi:hypothetical protein